MGGVEKVRGRENERGTGKGIMGGRGKAEKRR